MPAQSVSEIRLKIIMENKSWFSPTVLMQCIQNSIWTGLITSDLSYTISVRHKLNRKESGIQLTQDLLKRTISQHSSNFGVAAGFKNPRLWPLITGATRKICQFLKCNTLGPFMNKYQFDLAVAKPTIKIVLRLRKGRKGLNLECTQLN